MGSETDKPKHSRLRHAGGGVVVLVVLSAAALLAAESFRQWDISRAEGTLEAVIQEARAEFPEGDDWRVWYRDLLGGADGAEAFRAWSERVSDFSELDDPDDEFRRIGSILDHFYWALSRGYNPPGIPDPDILSEFLARTDALASEVDDLLRFERLLGEPETDVNGWPARRHLPIWNGFELLRNRVVVQLWLGNEVQAWHEAERLGELWLRFHVPAGASLFSLQASIFKYVQHCFETLSAHGAPTQGARRLVPFAPPTFEWSEQVAPELAFFAAAMKSSGRELATPEPPNPCRDYPRGWFGWVSTEVDFWWKDFAEPAQNASGLADYARQLLAWHHHYQLGVPKPEKPLVGRLWGIEIDYKEIFGEREEARAKFLADRVNLAFALREAEAAGTPLHEFNLDPEQWSGLTLEPVPESKGGGVIISGFSPDADPDFDPPVATHIRPVVP